MELPPGPKMAVQGGGMTKANLDSISGAPVISGKVLTSLSLLSFPVKWDGCNYF